MTTLTIHPASEDQETAIRIFLDALHVDYKTNDVSDETDYQMSSPANMAHLKESIAQGQKGEVTQLGLDDIWKE
jgi:hypothetical protein